MKQTPLFAAHQRRDAQMDTVSGSIVATQYAGVDEEVAAATNGAALFDLCQVETLTLESPEAARWCHGMFTNHVKGLVPGKGNRSVMCDDRGRVLGLIDLYRDEGDRFFGVLEGVDLDWFESRYKMFLFLDDIELEAQPDAPWLLSLQGPHADQVLRKLGLPIPEAPHDHAYAGGDEGIRVCRKARTHLQGFDLFVPTEALETTWEALVASGATPCGIKALEALRILAGRARWPQDGTDKSMVHELRYNEECCSFTKGCYVGQEVINRIDVKGQVVKRLTGLRMKEDAVPPAGASVFLEDKAVGTISSSIRVDGRVLAMAVLRKTAWEAGQDVTIRTDDRSVQATVSDLPFAE